MSLSDSPRKTRDFHTKHHTGSPSITVGQICCLFHISVWKPSIQQQDPRSYDMGSKRLVMQPSEGRGKLFANGPDFSGPLRITVIL